MTCVSIFFFIRFETSKWAAELNKQSSFPERAVCLDPRHCAGSVSFATQSENTGEKRNKDTALNANMSISLNLSEQEYIGIN